jgi:hypothetical protein
VGRAGSLYLVAFRLARSDHGLTPRSNALEIKAIGHLFLTRRWTELDPLIYDVWSRREQMPDDKRAWLVMPLAWHLFSRGRVGDSWRLMQEELTYLESVGAGESVPSLHSQAAYLAWLRGDPELALMYIEHGLEAADRRGDDGSMWWAQHHRIHIDYRLTGDRPAAIGAFRDNVVAAKALGITDGEALSLWDLACHTGSRQDLAAGLVAAEHAGAISTMQDLHVLEGALLLLEGRADEAESLFVRFGSRIRAGEPVAAPWIDVCRAWCICIGASLRRRATFCTVHRARPRLRRTSTTIADRSLALGWLALGGGALGRSRGSPRAVGPVMAYGMLAHSRGRSALPAATGRRAASDSSRRRRRNAVRARTGGRWHAFLRGWSGGRQVSTSADRHPGRGSTSERGRCAVALAVRPDRHVARRIARRLGFRSQRGDPVRGDRGNIGRSALRESAAASGRSAVETSSGESAVGA